MDGEPDRGIATLTLPGGGRAVLQRDGRLVWSSAGGSRASAGDGIAAALADLVRSGDTSGIEVSAGALRVEAGGAESARGGAAALADADDCARETAIPVDQTNLSVVVDGVSVVKLVGEWGSADRSTGILARLEGTGISASFGGALHWLVPGWGESTVALSTGFVRGATDGWTWAVEDVLAWRAGSGGADPAWPTAVGELTGRLHSTLGAGAPVVTVSTGEAAARAEEAVRLARASVAGTDTASRLTARRSSLSEASSFSAGSASLPAFTAHGDLHVGQMLRRPSDDPGAWTSYRVIDFDGAPQTEHGDDAAEGGAAEQPTTAAVDVAHLLTSIDLVASIAQRRLGAPDPVIRAWAARAREQAHTSYLRTLESTGADLVGDDPTTWDELVSTGEVEQFAREMLYARRYLPRWLYAADGAVSARYAPDPDLEDPPWTPPASPTTSD